MIHFEAPWVWLALPPLLAWVGWLSRKSYAHMTPWARWMSAGLRVALIVLLLGALSRPVWVHSTQGQHVVFLVDASRSVSKDNMVAAMADVDRLAREATGSGGHRVSVIAFGRRPRVVAEPNSSWPGWTDAQRDLLLHESSLPALNQKLAALATENAPEAQRAEVHKRIAAATEFREQVAGEHTDAHAAVRLAESIGPVDEARTIYLLTDANFTRGDWAAALTAAAARGDAVRTIAMDKPSPPEVAATHLTLPNSVRVNQSLSADLRVASTVETPAKIVIYRDGYQWGELSRTLKPGENTITVPGLFFRDKGFHTVDAVVRAQTDTRVENNRARALVVVPGELRVLYVDSDESRQSYLTSALSLEGIQVEARPATGVPRSLEQLLGFDALILCNVPADKLTAASMQMIRTYVQDFGGGFIMIGGENSFGLGGYYGTPIEDVLPVRMPIQKDLNRPSLAIVLVIDKSGSMEGVKIQLAKRAAVATSEAINPRDQIGVVGFDSDARTILDLTAAGDRATINSAIAGLEAGGGTFLYPGLEIAREQLQSSNARRKHVIVLSDGQTQGFGYPEMAQMMGADGITISTVGIGEGADMKLLEQIAASGGGRAYFTNEFQSIPQIFTREALRASNSMLVERLVVPTMTDEDEAVSEIDSELPPLGGYVATTPKDGAKVIITSDSGDPILAKWRFGLGRTAAFTSETKPRWAEDWLKWPEFAKFWAQLVRSVAGQEVNKDLSVQVSHEVRDDGVRVSAEIRDAADNFVTDRVPELMVHDATSGSRVVELRHEAPGVFAATVPQGEYATTQQFAWRVPPAAQQGKRPGGDAMVVPFGLVESFSPEFATLGPDEATLGEMKRRGSVVEQVGSATLALDKRVSTHRVILWPALLIAALLLVPLDILVRRLS